MPLLCPECGETVWDDTVGDDATGDEPIEYDDAPCEDCQEGD